MGGSQHTPESVIFFDGSALDKVINRRRGEEPISDRELYGGECGYLSETAAMSAICR